MEEKMLDKSFGVKFDFEISTDTRSFAVVDAALITAEIPKEHWPDKPNKGRAIARAMMCLQRTCAASIEFPAWSQWANWENKRSNEKRNPNLSLKITQVKKASTDTSVAWRINIADATKKGENMGHVLNVTYSPDHGVYFTEGTDKGAFQAFGKEMQEIVNAEFNRFLTNYNDEDIRRVLDTELSSMRALKVIKNTNCFIPRDYVERARKLYQFAKDCDQTVSWLGLDSSEMTRESLLADLKKAIFSDLEAYEAEMDKKLNAPEGERKRGEQQRQRMFMTANDNIDSIMAMAEYHAQVLGVMIEGIQERQTALKQKATEFLTRDFSKNNAPVQAPAPANKPVTNPDEVF